MRDAEPSRLKKGCGNPRMLWCGYAAQNREEKLQIIVTGWLWHAGKLSVCKCALDANMDLIENTCMRNLT